MRLPVIFIFFTIVLDSMGIGIIMPVMPDLIREVGNINLSEAALWGGALSAAFAVNQFLFSPTIGSGPMLGGVLAEYGSRAPFFAAAALAFINMLFGYFVLPETVTDSIRRPFDWKRSNPFGAFKQMRKLPGLVPLLSVFLLLSIAFFVYPAIWAFFGRAQFGWDARMVGLSLAAYGLGIVIIQGVLIGPILKRFGERTTAVFGMTVHFCSFLIYPFMTQTWHIFAFMPISVFSAVAVPALQGLMSNSVAKNAQGELQGAMGSLTAVATIVSPLLMTQVFSFFTADDAPVYLPAAPFLLSALSVLIAFLILRKFSSARI